LDPRFFVKPRLRNWFSWGLAPHQTSRRGRRKFFDDCLEHLPFVTNVGDDVQPLLLKKSFSPRLFLRASAVRIQICVFRTIDAQAGALLSCRYALMSGTACSELLQQSSRQGHELWVTLKWILQSCRVRGKAEWKSIRRKVNVLNMVFRSINSVEHNIHTC
jgi:hypothetical protein